MKLDGPGEWKKGSDVNIDLTAEYVRPSKEDHPKPITFRTVAFYSDGAGRSSRKGFATYRQNGEIWEPYISDRNEGFMLVDLPPIDIHVGDRGRFDDQFVSLSPGETWKRSFTISDDYYSQIPTDARVGEKFKYLMKGAFVDWWDWGTKEDHKGTPVTLHCFGEAKG
jgi:hypothetical protein